MTNPAQHRKRGIQASRARLTHALAQAGLKTQAALAERIADIEGLDAAPRDVVNRVFRELPVELVTIERVANALAVEAHTLYKTSDEFDPADSGGVSNAQPSTSRSLRVAFGLVALLLVAIFARDYFWQPDDTPVAPGIKLDLGTSTVLVVDFPGDEGGHFSDRLRVALAEDYRVANNSAGVLVDDLDPAAVAEKFRTDAVVDGEVVAVGRLSAIRVYAYSDGVRRQVWADSWPTVTTGDQYERVATSVRNAFVSGADQGPHFPLAPVQDNYLEGQLYLTRPSTELNIKRAQARFETALRQDANYARAHAGLCATLLEEHWMSDEALALEDAALTCAQALQLDPNNPVVAAAHASFLQRTGRKSESIALYEEIIADNPLDSVALSGLAAVLLDEYRQTGERDYLIRAKTLAREAANVDPYVWKPLFALATYEWFDGNVDGAIAASEEAIVRDENEFVLANLGNFYLCNGAFDYAREAYLSARELNPNSYIGDEFLGMAYYFLGDFEQSALLRQRAIDSIAEGDPEIHEMWGNLGDSYRQIGDNARAVDAYTKAAEIAERDYLRGNAPVADQSARFFYYTVLNDLVPGKVPDSVLSSINDEIDVTAAELKAASAHRRMAQTYLLRGEIAKARQATARATETCRGYSDWPDLASLN